MMMQTIGVELGATVEVGGTGVWLGSVVAVGPPGVWVGAIVGVDVADGGMAVAVAVGTIAVFVLVGTSVAVGPPGVCVGKMGVLVEVGTTAVLVRVAVPVVDTTGVGVGVETGLEPDIFEMNPSLVPAFSGWKGLAIGKSGEPVPVPPPITALPTWSIRTA